MGCARPLTILWAPAHPHSLHELNLLLSVMFQPGPKELASFFPCSHRCRPTIVIDSSSPRRSSDTATQAQYSASSVLIFLKCSNLTQPPQHMGSGNQGPTSTGDNKLLDYPVDSGDFQVFSRLSKPCFGIIALPGWESVRHS